MISLREQTGIFEVIFAAFGAAGLILMTLFPVTGRIIVLVSLVLAALCYMGCGLKVMRLADEDRFTRLVLMVNMLASAVVSVILFILLRWLPGKMALGIPAAGLAVICITLNLAHKYIYQINDENYSSNQVRQIMLLGLVLLFLFADG